MQIMPSHSPSGGLSALSPDLIHNALPFFTLRRRSAGGSFLLLDQTRCDFAFRGGDDCTGYSATGRQFGS